MVEENLNITVSQNLLYVDASLQNYTLDRPQSLSLVTSLRR